MSERTSLNADARFRRRAGHALAWAGLAMGFACAAVFGLRAGLGLEPAPQVRAVAQPMTPQRLPDSRAKTKGKIRPTWKMDSFDPLDGRVNLGGPAGPGEEIEFSPLRDWAVENAVALAPVWAAAKVSRIDVVGIGDSNQLFDGTGWDSGWTVALAERFGIYASGLISAGENFGMGAGTGHDVGGISFASGPGTQMSWAGPPAPLNAVLGSTGLLGPQFSAYLEAGKVEPGTGRLGLVMAPGSVVGESSNLRVHFAYGFFGPVEGLTAEAGRFTPQARIAGASFPELARGASVESVGAGPAGLRWGTIDVPAAPRVVTGWGNLGVEFRWNAWESPLQGPFVAYWSRFENRDRARGASMHTLYGVGGHSARRMALALQQIPDATLSAYFAHIRSLQGPTKRVLVRICSGLNDRSDWNPSVGPARVQFSWRAAGFADNLLAMRQRLEQIWTLNGWDLSELYFLLTVSHPPYQIDDSKLAEYRLVTRQLAQLWPRTAAFNFLGVTTANELYAQCWFAYCGDKFHLSPAGFVGTSRLELEQLVNQSGQ
ncbi:MAG: hypothetical protein SFY95_03390 [Planctomycetota bacterium]|nr:hypothetical protein [Planctomycetota bacterium]